MPFEGLVKSPYSFKEFRDKFIKKHGPELWERAAGEKSARRMLEHFRGLNEKLIDGVVMGRLAARKMRNNKVAILPFTNENSIICCAICNNIPVVSSMALVPDRDPAPGEDDVTFIFFICEKHAADPEQTQAELDRDAFLWRLLQVRKEMIREGKMDEEEERD